MQRYILYLIYLSIFIENANQGLKAAQLLPERQNLHNRMQAQRSLRSKGQLHSPCPKWQDTQYVLSFRQLVLLILFPQVDDPRL
ncbi:hypothetical protein D0T84_11910 [Dysgonomonas sp. 521]|nr:hypothetical protein [Dysgonomonas sp. 521]